MNENRVNLPINLVHQEGAVLVVALVLLVVLTMLGISGIESTKLETRMADNVRKYNVAFQKAEAGIATTFNQCRDNAVAGNIKCPNQENADFRSQVDDLNTTCVPANSGGGSLNKLVRLTTSKGTSDSFSDSNAIKDPNAIEVTLVAGMWLPAASDNMMLKMTNKEKCNKPDEKCSLSSGTKNACGSSPESNEESAEACAQAIEADFKAQPEVDDAQKCLNELISEACQTSPAPSTCSTTINSHINPISLPEICKSAPNSEDCNKKIEQACQNLPPEKVAECTKELKDESNNQTK